MVSCIVAYVKKIIAWTVQIKGDKIHHLVLMTMNRNKNRLICAIKDMNRLLYIRNPMITIKILSVIDVPNESIPNRELFIVQSVG